MKKIVPILFFGLSLFAFEKNVNALRYVSVEGNSLETRIRATNEEMQSHLPYIFPGITVKLGGTGVTLFNSFIAIHPQVLLTCGHLVVDQLVDKKQKASIQKGGLAVELILKDQKHIGTLVVHPLYVSPPLHYNHDFGFDSSFIDNRIMLEKEIGSTSNPQYDVGLIFLDKPLVGLGQFASLSAAEPDLAANMDAQLASCGFLGLNYRSYQSTYGSAQTDDEKFVALQNALFIRALQTSKLDAAFKFLYRQKGDIRVFFDAQKNAFYSKNLFPKGDEETLFVSPTDHAPSERSVATIPGDSGGALIVQENEQCVVKGIISSNTRVSFKQVNDETYNLIFGSDYLIPNKAYFTPIFLSKNWIDEQLAQRQMQIQWVQ